MSVNMSYCRFRNTLEALRECSDALYDVGPDPFAELSDEEAKAARGLMKLCGELAAGFGEDAQGAGMSTYFHGGRPGIQRGAFLLPPSITKTKHCSLYGAAGIHRTDRVYVTTERNAALLFAAAWPGGVIYECEPIGELRDDPDCQPSGISFECEKARVLRVIKLSKAERDMALRALFAEAGEQG